jgi:chromosome segregation ATPase
MQPQSIENVDRRTMPELDHNGVRYWDNRGAVDTVSAPAVDSDVVTIDMLDEILIKCFDKLHDSVQAALDKRDREIRMLRDEVGLERGLAKLKTEVDEARQQARERELESLQRELGTLRNEVELKLNLKSELAAARAEIEDLPQRAPSFESELNGLREQVAKQEKTIRRLRGEQSQLAYAQKQLDAEQQKNRQQVTLTAVQLTAIGGQTREVLERLRENGVDFIEEWSPSGLAS